MNYKINQVLQVLDSKTNNVIEVVITKIEESKTEGTILFVRRKDNKQFRAGVFNIWIKG